uniref:UDENN domain-containing protein n=1 Tax=Acrobeloides nanus TaxID=290746 RepID=A0A914BWN1_9BILA
MVETDLTLIDYFSVIGFDESVGLKPDHSADVISDYVEASTSNQNQPPLERSYVARILAHFPETRPGFPFAQEISSLCMPKGLRFYTEKIEPKFHSFVNIREDGTRINGCCLTLYEEVQDEQLRQEIVNLQMEHVKDLAMFADGELYLLVSS